MVTLDVESSVLTAVAVLVLVFALLSVRTDNIKDWPADWLAALFSHSLSSHSEIKEERGYRYIEISQSSDLLPPTD